MIRFPPEHNPFNPNKITGTFIIIFWDPKLLLKITVILFYWEFKNDYNIKLTVHIQ